MNAINSGVRKRRFALLLHAGYGEGFSVAPVLRTALSLLAMATWQGFAQETPIQPGEYITDGGAGQLSISRSQVGELAFTIMRVGDNGHECAVDGKIGSSGRAALKTDDRAGLCVVSLLPRHHGVDVLIHTPQACRFFCGARADFEGLYLKPAPGCDRASQREARAQFKRHYDKRAYVSAKAALEPLLSNCAQSLDWLETGWIRNDLALTLYKLDDLAGCRRLLEPLAAEAAMADTDIGKKYPPVDALSYLPVVRAARTNLKLCSGGAGKGMVRPGR